MEYNITSWLQDDINLNHSSESDLSDIIYDPRYGSLFRRFINFLAKSTLCNQKYPNVFVNEEKFAAEKDLEEKLKDRDEIKVKLENYIKENSILEEELSLLKFQHDSYQSIERIQLETNQLMENIAKRDSFRLEQVAINLDRSYEYLNNNDLSMIYNEKGINEILRVDDDDMIKATFISNQQLFSFDQELNNIIDEINKIHNLISNKQTVLINLIGNQDSRLNLKKKPNINEKKIVIKLPQFINNDSEIESLRESNEKLEKQLKEVAQSVSELNKTYKNKKSGIEKPYENIVEEYLSPTVSMANK